MYIYIYMPFKCTYTYIYISRWPNGIYVRNIYVNIHIRIHICIRIGIEYLQQGGLYKKITSAYEIFNKV